MKIECKLASNAVLPNRAHSTDAGADICAAASYTIYPGEQALVDTGVAVKIPKGLTGLIFNRSSQGKRGISIPHSVGVIDSDYRGNLLVLLRNNSEDPYIINVGDRVAQLVVIPVSLPTFTEFNWDDTSRGTGGFGSTGTK